MPHTVVDSNKGFRSKTLAKDASFSFTFATAGDYELFVLDPPEHEGQSHRQASQLMFSLSDMVRIAMIRAAFARIQHEYGWRLCGLGTRPARFLRRRIGRG